MGRFKELRDNASYTLKEEGIYAFADRFKLHASNHKPSFKKPVDPLDICTDVLFINGCAYSVPHPVRYRVDHQVEQLISAGMSARKIDEWFLADNHVRTARIFVIFRCPYNDRIGNFIKLAKSLNKTVLYDIDDLVIDRKYTDQIKFLDTLSPEERQGYDAGVDAMQKTMLMCDGVITTTAGMAEELRSYLSTVFVNRNVASEEMLKYSQMALEERDKFPFMEVEKVSARNKRRWKNAVQRYAERDKDAINIGYFSGSITHNEDFEFIIPALVKIMREHTNVYLHVVGELDVPDELKEFESRIVAAPFLPWRRLPKLISQMQINIAPLVDTIFNRAKSENKWLEASLVKVPTIASNVGAFADCIEDEVTGLLCDGPDDWYEALNRLINDAALRRCLANNAYQECVAKKITVSSGVALKNFLNSVAGKSIGFAVPSLNISGGNLVTFHHAAVMQSRGYDVTLVDGFGEDLWLDVEGRRLPVVNRRVLPDDIDGCPIDMHFSHLVATFWETALFVDLYRKADRRSYLVQSYETDFYPPCHGQRFRVPTTYSNSRLKYLTISQWCKNWLSDIFLDEVSCARNGIFVSDFNRVERDFSQKVRILIEGDCAVDYKNVDEAFRITEKLDPSKFEVWYLSYNGKPKDNYKFDKFLHQVPHEEISSVYEQCHILLKTSLVESFSYPPLEMMATGGLSVAISNPGNAEILVDGVNSLLFQEGEDDKAVELINSLINDAELRERLIAGGYETVDSRDWSKLEDEIVALYE